MKQIDTKKKQMQLNTDIRLMTGMETGAGLGAGDWVLPRSPGYRGYTVYVLNFPHWHGSGRREMVGTAGGGA